MPLDPSIYQQMQPNLAGQLAGTLNQFTEQRARLSDLAQQREQQDVMQGFQTRALQRAEEAYPAKQAEVQRQQAMKHKQELNLGVSTMLRQGATPEQVMQWGTKESQARGIDPQLTQQHLTQVFSSGKTPEELANVFEEAAYPQEVAKQRFEQRFAAQKQESPFAKIETSKFTPESIMDFVKTKDYTTLVPIDKTGGDGSAFAKVSTEKFTPESIASFTKTGDYSVLTPRKEEEAPAVAKKRIQDIEMKLADDYRTESKGWAETSTSMKKALGAIDNADKNPGSALAAGTAFMKILDPGSVVRETELGMALNASGWFDRAGNITEKLQSGVVMTKLQQKQLKAAALDLFEEAKKAQLEIDKSYEGRAKEYGANPKNIITQRGQLLPDTRKKEPAQITQGLPKTGDIQDGYVFIGGIPSDPKSWRKQ